VTEIPGEGAPARPERVIVKPPRDSRLEALLCLYESRKAEDARTEREFKELKAAILAELEDIFTGSARPETAYEIAPTVMYPALTVSYKSQEYLPVSVIREHFPEIFEKFKVRKPTFAEIREARQK
jgi:hypothetical protein